MKYFKKINQINNHSKVKGVALKVLFGEKEEDKFAISQYELEPGHSIPSHAHKEHQIGIVLSGQLRAWIDDEETDLFEGDMYQIPPNKLHGCLAIGDKVCKKIDFVYPKRKKNVDTFNSIMNN